MKPRAAEPTSRVARNKDRTLPASPAAFCALGDSATRQLAKQSQLKSSRGLSGADRRRKRWSMRQNNGVTISLRPNELAGPGASSRGRTGTWSRKIVRSTAQHRTAQPFTGCSPRLRRQATGCRCGRHTNRIANLKNVEQSLEEHVWFVC
jgi:hypothetical protein